jgi:hypothetical protein
MAARLPFDWRLIEDFSQTSFKPQYPVTLPLAAPAPAS